MGILVLVEKKICNVKHLEKFPNVFGGPYTYEKSIPPMKAE
jgi:hypothetical protein